MQNHEEEHGKCRVIRRALAQSRLGRLGGVGSRGLQLLRDGVDGVPDPAQQRVEDQQKGHVRQVYPEGVVLGIRHVL